MLNENCKLVLNYLKKHFSESDRPLSVLDLSSLGIGLELEEIDQCIKYLDKIGYIEVNSKYISDIVVGVN